MKRAKKAALRSYSPYSNFKVGAAILLDTGKVFTGTNVENASYGLTICAERSALVKAVSETDKPFKILGVAVYAEKLPIPCGACLQVLSEFSTELTTVLVSDFDGVPLEYSFMELLPRTFQL
jgi:cytidine deaminase